MDIPAKIQIDESKLVSLVPNKLFWPTIYLTIVCAIAYGIGYWELCMEVNDLRQEQDAMKKIIMLMLEHGPENVHIVPPNSNTQF